MYCSHCGQAADTTARFCGRCGQRLWTGSATPAQAPAARTALLVVVVILGSLPVLGILAAIAIPAYHDYTVRSRVAAAHALGERAAAAVAAYHAETGQWPQTLADTGVTLPASAEVQALTVDGGNGVITLTLARAPVAGRSLLLAPVHTDAGTLEWDCVNLDLQPRHLPQACRGDAAAASDDEHDYGSVTL